VSGIVGPTLELIQVLVASNPQGAGMDTRDRVDPRIAAALDHIDAHYGAPLTVAGLAALAGLSPGHFSRSFRAAMGEPVWAYVQRLRCERASDLLRGTDLPLAEIAYRCGFASQAHMTTACRRAFGATPGAIRAGG
jgi:transcriptional regulator GlxA family with amidase domain